MEAGYQVHLANTAAMRQKVFGLQNLCAVFKHGKKNKGKAGLDRVSIKQFESDLENKRSKYSQGLNGWVLNSIENMLKADIIDKELGSEKLTAEYFLFYLSLMYCSMREDANIFC